LGRNKVSNGRKSAKARDALKASAANIAQHTNKFAIVATSSLTRYPHNPRKHPRDQIEAIAKSIQTFGFAAPVLIDKDNKIIAGHGRVEAANLLGLKEVPAVRLDHLGPDQARAYMLADNKLTDRSTWDDASLAVHLKELSELALDFEIEATGFELPEIDYRIQSLEEADAEETADEFKLATGRAVSALGDVWVLGQHLLICGNALEASNYEQLLGDQKASVALTDPPYNVRIDGHVSGKGEITHREFPMAAGEMSEPDFINFLTTSFANICAYTTPGALLYSFMDWRHMAELQQAGLHSGCDLLNLCVWVKSNGGMGSLYRSRHELVFVFRNGREAHVNNVQLGRFGRNRSNVWNYPSPNAFGRAGSVRPTIKPVGLVADAILDASRRNDIVLDPFCGSGTTVLAAERTSRRCRGIELDPLYVDTTIERWQQMTGRKAHTQLGETYDQIKARRMAADE
jgi:DNA modification methylase